MSAHKQNIKQTPASSLPLILAGPIIRHVDNGQLVVWLVTSEAVTIEMSCYEAEECLGGTAFDNDHGGYVALGAHAHLHLLTFSPEQTFPQDTWLSYDIGIKPVANDAPMQWLSETSPELMYGEAKRPDFIIKSRIDHVLHGSCRKPHHAESDGLLRVDDVLATAREADADIAGQPALLMMSGDQIYADDVGGPVLLAVQQVIELLGLPDDPVEGLKNCSCGKELRGSDNNFYGRTKLLPDDKASATLRETFFMGASKPVFTSANADNHLITLGEVLAMYLLVWSPVVWRYVDLDNVELDQEKRARYQTELPYVQSFVEGLGRVQRALAHVPVYMIFDDHDVTDDWNLTRGWEESAYGQPFSRRIIGNALIGYLLCQGWGNTPDKFPVDLLDQVRDVLEHDTQQKHDDLVDLLLKFRGWNYSLETQPKLVVLDTRTQRWRSEYGEGEPSGLMDWEALSDLQQELIGQDAVILVSPPPIFGVKLIEVIQRIFTWFGYALTVDAENWMSHRGAAQVILNIFRHPRTPKNFVILSGDVHYSFAYDVRLRDHEESPKIWQITSSGIKGTFPEKLLLIFDRLNRWLFASHSPLNWFTRRRHMHIRPRRPADHTGRYRHQRLLNGNGIGRLRLNDQGEPEEIEVLWVDGQDIKFGAGYERDWH
uniref:PhoD-like phosphatase n=1 Tax=uncultured Thiotrichaceae bacterium TaxID=298394 RepID=A0A6S6U039_9GAMM|nr:MAG: PhoD-like phosphatase [uncultured Thiotrichaceae bacterium]